MSGSLGRAAILASSRIIASDRRAEKGKYWNPNALGLMLGALHRAEEETAKKLGVAAFPKERDDAAAHHAFQAAILRNFNQPLAGQIIKAMSK